MDSNRKDVPGTRPVLRTDKLLHEGDQWFFRTREGTLEGPFDSDIQALNQLIQYVKLLNAGELPDVARPGTYRLRKRA